MFFVWVIIVGLLQATVLSDLNLLFVMAVFAGLKKGPYLGVLIGAAIGIFVGILSAASLGLVLMFYSIAGLISGIISSRFYYFKLD